MTWDTVGEKPVSSSVALMAVSNSVRVISGRIDLKASSADLNGTAARVRELTCASESATLKCTPACDWDTSAALIGCDIEACDFAMGCEFPATSGVVSPSAFLTRSNMIFNENCDLRR